MTEIVGILNLTRDSFSDGGRYLDPERAVEHALALAEDGAHWIDVGAESTHPDAEVLDEVEELARLEPVVAALVERGLAVSVDTWRPAVMRRMLAVGCGMINDVRGFRTPGAIDAVGDSDAWLVVMHSTSPSARATRREPDTGSSSLPTTILAFFEERLAALGAGGVDPERVILDPGMGFFLSPEAADSVATLRALPRLRELGRPLYISTSRKSFLGALTGREVSERGAATLASELYAWHQGVDYIRTHDVAALVDGVRVARALWGADEG